MQKKVDVRDYYIDEQGNLVFTEYFLQKRGTCCGNDCKHCPYKKQHKITCKK